MAPRIAILGWGSLLWESHPKFDDQHGPWSLDGPSLKLEFSRISETRLGALTLVIDDVANDLPTQVAYCDSKRSQCGQAREDLRVREGCNIDKIGFLDVKSGDSHCQPENKSAHQSILDWAQQKSFGAVVWTDLRSNFAEKKKQSFSVAAAVQHLKDLEKSGKKQAKDKALEYLWRAPHFVDTPLRRELRARLWFSQND